MTLPLAVCLAFLTDEPMLDCLAPLPEAGRAIEKAYGIKLDLPKSLATQVVYVRTRDSHPNQVLKHLAQSLDCSVEFKEDKWRLTRDPKLLAQRRREEADERRRVLEPQFAKLVKEAETPYKVVLDKLAQQGPKATLGYTQKPGDRALLRILAFFRAESLAELDLSEYRTYSLPPGRGDLALSRQAVQALLEMNQENSRLSQALSQFEISQRPFANPYSMVRAGGPREASPSERSCHQQKPESAAKRPLRLQQ